MSDFKQLLSILNRELEKQEALLKLLVRERTAIVRVNQEDIERLFPEKEVLFEEIRTIVTSRNEAIYSLAEKYLKKEAVQLDTVISKCPQSDVRAQLNRSRKDIKDTASAIDELNKLNGQLIRKTLGLVTSSLSILCGGASDSSETYLASGSIRKEDDSSTPLNSRSLNKEV